MAHLSITHKKPKPSAWNSPVNWRLRFEPEESLGEFAQAHSGWTIKTLSNGDRVIEQTVGTKDRDNFARNHRNWCENTMGVQIEAMAETEDLF